MSMNHLIQKTQYKRYGNIKMDHKRSSMRKCGLVSLGSGRFISFCEYGNKLSWLHKRYGKSRLAEQPQASAREFCCMGVQ